MEQLNFKYSVETLLQFSVVLVVCCLVYLCLSLHLHFRVAAPQVPLDRRSTKKDDCLEKSTEDCGMHGGCMPAERHFGPICVVLCIIIHNFILNSRYLRDLIFERLGWAKTGNGN